MKVSKIGTISDLVADPDHLYLLGSRGLEVAGPNGERIADTIQVEADHALARMGRFLFLVGNRSMEVLDMGPYQAAPASPVPQG